MQATGSLSHAARANVFQREATWRLAPDALTREGGEAASAPAWAHAFRILLRILWPWQPIRIEAGGSARFPYAAVSALRLSFDPTRFDARRHRCDVTLADGERAVIFSTHYVSVGEFEDRGPSYAALVRELIGRVAAAKAACRFRAGKRPLVYWAEHAFLLAMLAALVWVIGLVGGAGLSELTWLKLAIVASFIPLLLRYTRKNRPRRFDPAAIPSDVLPD